MPERRPALARYLRGLPIALLAIGAAASIIPANLARADGLTVTDAIRQALKNNERSKIADLKVVQAEGAVESARGAFLPTITLGGSAQLNGHADHNGNYEAGSGNFTIKQPILHPSAIPTYRASKISLDSAREQDVVDYRSLEFDTARAFVQVISAEAVLKASQGRLDRAKADLDDTQARVDAELNSSNDATRARLDVTTALKGVTDSKSNLDRARLALELLLGQPVDGTLAAPDDLTKAAGDFKGAKEGLVKSALDVRPDLKKAHLDTLAARESAEEPLWRLAPSIDLQGQFTANPLPGQGNPWDSEQLMLSLSWTIFDGGVRYGDRKSKVAVADSAEYQEKAIVRTVDSGVRSALVELFAAQESLRTALQVSEVAAANSEETAILYKQGLARAIELTDANASMFDADVSLAVAKLNLVNAYFDLRSAQGLEPTEQNLGPKTTNDGGSSK